MTLHFKKNTFMDKKYLSVIGFDHDGVLSVQRTKTENFY